MRLLHFISKRVQQCFSIKLMKKEWKTEKILISGCFSYTPAGCCLHELISTLLKISWSILNSRSTNVMIFFVVITKCVIKRVTVNFWLNSIKIIFASKYYECFCSVGVAKNPSSSAWMTVVTQEFTRDGDWKTKVTLP